MASPENRPSPGAPEPFPEREVFLAIVRTADGLLADLNQLLRGRDLSAPLYNVLRILRGAGPSGLPCGEIAARMINREPDMTRLVDRLEKRALVRRERGQEDRRVVRAVITPAGLELLAELDGPVAALHRAQLGHLDRATLDALRALLDEARPPERASRP